MSNLAFVELELLGGRFFFLAERIFRGFLFLGRRIFSCGFWVAGFFLLIFVGKKCPQKSSRKIPGKILENLYSKNPRHISAEGPGQELYIFQKAHSCDHLVCMMRYAELSVPKGGSRTPEVDSQTVSLDKAGEQDEHCGQVPEIHPSDLAMGNSIDTGASAEVFRASWHGLDCLVVRVGFWQNRVFADFYFWAAVFFLSSFLWDEVPRFREKSSRKIPGNKILQNLRNKNPRHISAEGPGHPKDPSVLKIVRRLNSARAAKFGTEIRKRYGDCSEMLVFPRKRTEKRYG